MLKRMNIVVPRECVCIAGGKVDCLEVRLGKSQIVCFDMFRYAVGLSDFFTI